MNTPPAIRRRALRRRLHALPAVLAFGSGCSIAFPVGDVQCQVDADCAARGPAFEGSVCSNEVCVPGDVTPSGPWSCLGEVEWPSTGAGAPRLSFRVIDVLTSSPPVGLEARVCSKLDIACDNPLPAPTSIDQQGLVTAEVSAGFDGYVELVSPTTTPALFFVTKPVHADTVVPGVIPVVSPEGFGAIAQAIGTTLDLQGSGHVYALSSDCDDAAARGVRFELDKMGAATTAYYMINNAPLGTAGATDAAGAGGFLNVPPGFVTITGFVADTDARVGDSSLVIRAGAVSYPRVVPSP